MRFKINHRNRRKLLDITLEEVIDILEICGYYYENKEYYLTVEEDKNSCSMGKIRKWVRVNYICPSIPSFNPKIIMNITDNIHAIHFVEGEMNFRDHYKVIQYLDKQGFDLETAVTTHTAYY